MKYITGIVSENNTPVADILVSAIEVGSSVGDEKFVGNDITDSAGRYVIPVEFGTTECMILAREKRGDFWLPNKNTLVGEKVTNLFDISDPLWNDTTVRVAGSDSVDNQAGGGSVEVEGYVPLTDHDTQYGKSIDFTIDNSGCLTYPSSCIYDVNYEITSDLTLELWFNPYYLGGGSEKNLIGTYWGGKGLWIHCTGSTTKSIRVYGTNNTANAKINIIGADDLIAEYTWYHLAVVKDGTTWTVYLDGNNIGSSTENGVVQAYSLSDHDGNKLRVGKGQGTSNTFMGMMCDIRVTKAVRYTGNFTPPDAPLPIGNNDDDCVFICTTPGVTGNNLPSVWNPDGETIDGTVGWTTRSKYKPTMNGPVVPVDLAPDLNRFFVARATHSEIFVMRYIHGKWIEENIDGVSGFDYYRAQEWRYGTLAISGDGKTIIAGDPEYSGNTDGAHNLITYDETTHVWNVEFILTNTIVSPTGFWHMGMNVSVNFDGTVYAMRGLDDRSGLIVRRKSGETWTTYHYTTSTQGPMQGPMNISADGNVVIVGSQNDVRFLVYRWNGTDDYVMEKYHDGGNNDSYGSALSPDGELFVMTDRSANQLEVYEYNGTDDWVNRETVATPEADPYSICISADKSKVAIQFKFREGTTYVRVGTYNGDNTWSWTDRLIAPNTYQFGTSLSFNQSGDRLFASGVYDIWYSSNKRVFEMTEANSWTDYKEIQPQKYYNTHFGHVVHCPQWV